MNPALHRLIRRRLLMVMGKGGTGKTSLAAALGVLAARHSVETVVIEVASLAALPALLSGDVPTPRESRSPFEAAPYLSTLRVIPKLALEEYLERQLPVGRLAGAIVRNAGFQRFLDAAPGWRELITLGKIWHLERQLQGGRPRYDLIVVDAPATGHGLSLLSVPGVVLDSVRLGPLHRHTDAVWSLLRDPEKTMVLPVSLPEELPVRETLELCARVRQLGLRAGTPIVNCVEAPPALADPDSLLDAIAELERNSAPSPLAEPAALGASLRQQVGRARMQREYIGKLQAGCDATPLELPYLVEGVQGPDAVELLADALEAALAQSGDPE